MHSIAVLLFMSFSIAAIAQQNDEVPENPWQIYGYIALGAVILIIAVVVLVRKQYRKFNE